MDTPYVTRGGDPMRIRTATEADIPSIFLLQAHAFGNSLSDRALKHWTDRVPVSNVLVVTDESAEYRGRIAAMTSWHPTELAVGNGATITMAGSEMTLVAPQYQRRGVLRAMMKAEFAECARQGFAVVGGLPSQGGVYERFGLGPATLRQDLTIDAANAQFREIGEPDLRAVNEISYDDAIHLLPAIYESTFRYETGRIARSSEWWAKFFEDGAVEDSLRSKCQFYIHERGYAAFHTERDGARRKTVVDDFIHNSVDSRVALLRSLLGLELAQTIQLHAKADPSVSLLLTDSWAASSHGAKGELWIRFTDIYRAIMGRPYEREFAVTVDVHDPLEVFAGCYSWSVHRGKCRFERVGDVGSSGRLPDLVIGASELAMIYLGGYSVLELYELSRIEINNMPPVRALDLALRRDANPYCGTSF